MKALKEQELNFTKGGNGYNIKSVKISTNGHKELYFDIEWRGKEPDYYEL